MKQLKRRWLRQRCLVAGLLLVLASLWIFRIEFLHSLAKRSLVIRDDDTADRWIEWAEYLAPGDPETSLLRVKLLRRRGLGPVAIRELETALERGLSPELANRQRYLLCAQSGLLAKAEPHLGEMLAANPAEAADVCEAFAIGYLKAHEFAKAQQLLSLWGDHFPDDPQPHLLRGAFLFEYRNWQEALQCFERVISLSPKHSIANNAAGECLVAMKQPERALEYFKAVETGSSQELCNSFRGKAICYRMLGDSGKARSAIEHGIKVAPTDLGLNSELAKLLISEGQYAEALRVIQPIVEANERDADARYTLAIAQRGVGLAEAANANFEQVTEQREAITRARNLAEEVASHDVDTRFEIAKLHFDFGDRSEAIWWLTSVLNLDPSHAEAKKLLEGSIEPTAEARGVGK